MFRFSNTIGFVGLGNMGVMWISIYRLVWHII